MRISHSLAFVSFRPTVVALGFFDGVHLGHRAVIEEARHRAAELSCDCAVFTFSQLPKEILSPGSVRMITDGEDRAEAIRSLGVDLLVSVPFDGSLKELSPTDFFRLILQEKLRARHLVCGYNYSFGAGGVGDAPLLRRLCHEAGIGLTVLSDVTVEGVSVSSSAIRQAVGEGKMAEVARLLGRPFSLRLPVIDGQKLARRLGFPTMNQRLSPQIVIPRHGVYVTRVRLPQQPLPFFGITNVGIRPTVGGKDVFAETHLFDFEGNLYGQQARIEFLRFLRPEHRFESIERLSEQVQEDIISAKAFLLTLPQEDPSGGDTR